MLVSASDLSFVTAAIQSWSLPQLSVKEKSEASSSAKVNLTSSLAILLLVVLANAGQGLVTSGSVAGQLILAWIVVEVLYFVYGKTRYSSVNQVVEVPLDVERVALIRERFLTLATVMPMEEFLEGWFMGARAEDVKRQNVEEFVAYGFYCRRLDRLTPQLQQAVSSFVEQVEESYGRKLEDGFNPNITFMAHMWEPLRTLPTPLCIHLGSMCAGVVAHLVLNMWGFERKSCQDLQYWYRPGSGDESEQVGSQQPQRQGALTRSMTHGQHFRGDSASSMGHHSSQTESARRPLVFIHGVGFGIMPYLGFLYQVCRANADHPVAVLDIPHVALRPFTRAKNVDSIAESVQKLLLHHRLPSACFVGHSFGSFCISRICQLYPAAVDSIVLMDPVCCMTCYPQLLSSFIYKGYTLQEALSSILGLAHALRFIFSRDLIIAETFCRQFLWHSLMLWPEDMPAKAVVSVSANDDLVPAELVRAHLAATKSHATVMLHPTAAHGGIFLDASHIQTLLSHIGRLLRS